MQNTLTLNSPIIRQISLKWKINLKPFWILSSVLVVILISFYIFQSNYLVRDSYLIKEYDKKLSDLSLENSNFKVNFAKSNSLENIESLVKNLDFEQIREVKYIQLYSSMAKRPTDLNILGNE